MTTAQKVEAVLAENPRWGRYKVAEFLKMSPNTVGRHIKKAKPNPISTPTGAKTPTQSFEENGDSATATTVDPRIKTLDDLLKVMKVDLAVWEVEKHIVNKWEVGIAVGDGDDKRVKTEPLFQVKAWLKRKSFEVKTLESLLDRLSDAPRPAFKKPVFQKSSYHKRSLEVCLMDVHMGLICQRPEADDAWDMTIAADTVREALADLLDLAKGFGPFEEIFIPFGNDFCHIDNVFATTTAGTGQPEAAAWHRMYVEAQALAIDIINRLRHEAPKVSIYQIPGNHSRMSDFTLGRILEAHFRNDKNVFVDASASPYKFHRCGVNLIGYEHGHSIKAQRMAGLMANERPKDWAETKYREIHCGDQHRKGSASFEEQGVSVEYIPGITAGNEWHRLKGFNHGKRGAMAYVWDWKKGPISRLQTNLFAYNN